MSEMNMHIITDISQHGTATHSETSILRYSVGHKMDARLPSFSYHPVFVNIIVKYGDFLLKYSQTRECWTTAMSHY